MHFAYPNVQENRQTEESVFRACVRYLSLPQDQAPEASYMLADPKTPDLHVIHDAVQMLVPERVEQPVQGQVYEVADTEGAWQGASLDLAYFLALIRCHRLCELDAVTDVGDVWCTGKMSSRGNPCPLEAVTPREFKAKLEGFLAQAHDRDRLFLVPAANVLPMQRDDCRAHQVQVLTLKDFGATLATARTTGCWPGPAVVQVDPRELPQLVDILFRRPSTPWHGRRWWASILSVMLLAGALIGWRLFSPPVPIAQTLSGMILDDDHRLLADVTVVLADFNLTTTTDQQGQFTFTVKAPQQRSVRLMAQKQGYTPHDTYATLGNPSFNFIMRKAP
jgi:hypothetical protein